jgi:hypothetical protein
MGFYSLPFMDFVLRPGVVAAAAAVSTMYRQRPAAV